MNKTIKKIKNQLLNNPIILYMKGSPKIPTCGFSLKAVEILKNCGEKFAYIDVITNNDIRIELPKFSNWPTFPQLWINNKLIGGYDIMKEMQKNGELKLLIKKTIKKYNKKN